MEEEAFITKCGVCGTLVLKDTLCKVCRILGERYGWTEA